jgi:lysophospholipase L1-like esterase
MGDSLVEGWPQKLLDDLFADRRVWRFGVGSDRTQNILWRLSDTRLASVSPAQVLNSAGTNNLGSGNSACGTVAGLQAIVSQVAEIWPAAEIHYLPIPPRGPEFDEMDQERREINGAVAAGLGDFSRVRYLPLDEAALTCGQQGQPSTGDPLLLGTPTAWLHCENYKEDNLHMTGTGYQVLTTALEPMLSDLEPQ